MIVVSASLVGIALLYLAIGENVLYGDQLQREKSAAFEQCKENKFAGEECQKYLMPAIHDQCIANKDLESPECYRFRTAVESAIFEECRANHDVESPLCQKYKGRFDIELTE